jgi:predicted RNA polymerase sigma factor
MLERLGRLPEAAAAFHRAAELETNQALRAVFVRRAEQRNGDHRQSFDTM